MQPVLLLENYPQTLAAARSLSAAGYRVIAGLPPASLQTSMDRAVAASSSVSECWTHPKFSDPAFAQALHAFCQARKVSAIFPIGEVSNPVLQHAAAMLPVIIAPPLAVQKICLHKAQACELAKQAGLPLPETVVAATIQEMDAAAKQIGLPVVIKPVNGLNPSLLGRKCWIFDADTPLPSAVLREADGERVLVQKYVEGRRHNCMFHARDGRMVAYFQAETVRTDQLDYTGNSTSLTSVPPSPRLLELTSQFVRRLGYDGPGCLQFLVAGDQAWFLECNPRLDETVELAVRCGVNLPLLALCCGQDTEPPGSPALGYKTGKRLHWWLADVEGGLQSLLNRRATPLQFLLWEARAALDAIRCDASMLSRWGDPRPAAGLTLDMLKAIARKLSRGARPAYQPDS